MLSGVIVAAALAAVVEHTIVGTNPVFHVPRLQNYTLAKASSLLWYTLLGFLAAVVSVAFTDSLLALRAWFKKLTTVPKWVQPAIGGSGDWMPGGGCNSICSMQTALPAIHIRLLPRRYWAI